MWILISESVDQIRLVLEQIENIGCSTRGVVVITGVIGDLEDYMPNENWWWEVMRGVTKFEALNTIFNRHPDEKFYGVINDIDFPVTERWDELLANAAGDWGIAYGNADGMGREIRGPVCIGGKLAKAVGYLALGKCKEWYGFDDVWGGIDSLVHTKRWMPGVKIERGHPAYITEDFKEVIARDKLVFAEWRSEGMTDAIRRVIEAGGYRK